MALDTEHRSADTGHRSAYAPDIRETDPADTPAADGPWNTPCHPPEVSGWGSTGWSCC